MSGETADAILQQSEADLKSSNTKDELTEVGGTPQPEITVDTQVFVCPFEGCEMELTGLDDVITHQKRVHAVKYFVCTQMWCGKTFERAYLLRQHVMAHIGQRPFPCPVNGCKANFTNASGLQRHITSFHMNKQLQADKLPKEGADTQGEAPAVNRIFACPVEACEEKGLNGLEAVIEHQKKVHSLKALLCPEAGCIKSFSSPCFLRQHIRAHAGEKSHLCPVDTCGASFISASGLRRHTRAVHAESMFQCPVPTCGKRFPERHRLNRHMKTMHSNVPRFQCPQCRKPFMDKISLDSHISTQH